MVSTLEPSGMLEFGNGLRKGLTSGILTFGCQASDVRKERNVGFDKFQTSESK